PWVAIRSRLCAVQLESVHHPGCGSFAPHFRERARRAWEATMDRAAAFVEGFRRFWSAPSLDGLPDLLAADAKLVQPLAPVMHGLDEVRRQFGPIFAWLPDLRGEVDRWSAAGDVVFIEFRLRATLGGRHFEWPVVDRFLLRA